MKYLVKSNIKTDPTDVLQLHTLRSEKYISTKMAKIIPEACNGVNFVFNKCTSSNSETGEDYLAYPANKLHVICFFQSVFEARNYINCIDGKSMVIGFFL